MPGGHAELVAQAAGDGGANVSPGCGCPQQAFVHVLGHVALRRPGG